MAATRQDIRDWFIQGVQEKKSHMLIVCDTYDWDDYPVFGDNLDDARKKYDEHNGKIMQRIMEVYNLSSNMEKQLAEHRSMNW